MGLDVVIKILDACAAAKMACIKLQKASIFPRAVCINSWLVYLLLIHQQLCFTRGFCCFVPMGNHNPAPGGGLYSNSSRDWFWICRLSDHHTLVQLKRIGSSMECRNPGKLSSTSALRTLLPLQWCPNDYHTGHGMGFLREGEERPTCVWNTTGSSVRYTRAPTTFATGNTIHCYVWPVTLVGFSVILCCQP